jgi:hypothetical protein
MCTIFAAELYPQRTDKLRKIRTDSLENYVGFANKRILKILFNVGLSGANQVRNVSNGDHNDCSDHCIERPGNCQPLAGE